MWLFTWEEKDFLDKLPCNSGTIEQISKNYVWTNIREWLFIVCVNKHITTQVLLYEVE
jgi:hypothetical protein